MNLFKKRNTSTKELIGIEQMTDFSIKTKQDQLVFFSIKPINLSVLSDSNIALKVKALMNLLQGFAEVEMLCMNSKESFDQNKAYFVERIKKEYNPAIRNLLEQDSHSLDELQVSMATAREFFMVMRFPRGKSGDLQQEITKIEQSLNDGGFVAKRADKEDLKRILSVYFEQNITSEQYEDFDGERWTI